MALRQRLHTFFTAWARPRRPEALPVYFDRKRIYVLPTPFGGFFGLLLLAMGLGALNYNNNPALLLCLLLGGAGLAGLLYAQLQLSGLSVQSLGGEPVPAGQALHLRVHVRADPGRERRGLRVACGDAFATLSLEAGVGEAVLTLPTERRGWLPPQRLHVSTTRPLGLARAWAWAWPDVPLLVYPAPEPHGPPLPTGIGNNAHARRNPAGDEPHHLRDWQRGDARRAIAWKPSARRDTLLVREYEQSTGVDVALDWNALPALPYEQRIRRLAHWIDAAEREARNYRLILPGQAAIGPAQGAQHRHACLRALALLPHQEHAHAQAG